MPARRRAGRATSSFFELAGDEIVQAEYSYDDDKQELVNDSIAGASSAAEAALPVPGTKSVQEEHHAVERQGAEQRSCSGNCMNV